MEYKVIAEIEIEDTRLLHYSTVIIRQRFNEHHEFVIRINLDILESYGSLELNNAKKLIGKNAIIRLKKIADTSETVYEFKGIICEIGIEQSDGFLGEMVFKGYSPTIMIDNGPHLTSFYKQGLEKILKKVTKPLSDNSCPVNFNLVYSKEIKYICQYKESSFQFLNRLCAEFSEWCFYDGMELNIGKPDSPPEIEITYGEDINSIQLNLRIVPMSFSNYSYISKDDKFESSKAPDKVSGLDQYASYALDESHNVFSSPINNPLRQRVESKNELEEFVKKEKAAKAADLEALTGRSDNPHICIGAVAAVGIAKKESNGFIKEDYGKFLITGVTHNLTENGRYYNTFEAIPSGLEIMPVKNINVPVAEPQIATVKDNKDPDKMGRVRVQMLWQQDNEWTDWIRVMTPDAGSAKDGAKNRGLVVVPETGDQVVVCFRYNDADRPFVLGSMFHGKTGGGGGDDNKSKSITTKTGSNLTFDESVRSIVLQTDATNNLKIEKTGDKISITSAAEIVFTTGSSSISMKKDGTISIKGVNLTIVGTSGEGESAPASGFSISPTEITIGAKNKCEIGAGKELTLASQGTAGIGANSEVNIGCKGAINVVAEGETAIQGAKVNLN